MVETVRKRDGRVVPFQQSKVTTAICKAFASAHKEDLATCQLLSDMVVDYVELAGNEPTDIEDIQDLIEKTLMEEGQTEVARNFILYRYRRAQFREAKAHAGVTDDCKLGLNAIRILESRYLHRDEQGNVEETPRQLFERVAKHVAMAERKLDGDEEKFRELFLQMMLNLEFIPNSPMLMNAGKRGGLISSCYVLPLEDSTEGIFTTLKDAVIIHKRGAGTGFSFSSIRPRRDSVKGMPGVASGPLAFLKIFDRATSEIKQGARRAGGNMAILRVDHPDIIDFITIKDERDTVNNYNLSVGITEEFMQALKKRSDYNLYDPRTGDVCGTLNSKRIFDLIGLMAWKNGDPGIVFLDRMNNDRSNPTPGLGQCETTSPCGEYPLLAYESVILGSVNLSKHLKGKAAQREVDYNKLKQTVHLAVRFLDDATEVNAFPLRQTREMVSGNRKIGLSIMGFADLLFMLRIPYDSRKALNLAEKLMEFIQTEARAASRMLAKERGVFLNFEDSLLKKKGAEYKQRNATLTAISPTGTISLIASCSPSIEPIYGISFLRKTARFEFLEVNPYFEEVAKEQGFYSEEMFRRIAGRSSIQEVQGIPDEVKKIFVTAMDLAPEDHVKMQAAFQKYLDCAVSKTVNFPHGASVDDIQRVFMLAYDLGCKGITVYRDGSREVQVLNSR
ncbi:ribonucleoside-diphosphate reductase, adenosylcobalamin-dependent [archaeon]|nr:ribonucleoside-diphosphate reductase, adenosylcobalamin-dependent [archaeon]|tara:strand:- start:717 stop:2741 length:2025 start_codon:yes stop_codon:yes gene_type:complete